MPPIPPFAARWPLAGVALALVFAVAPGVARGEAAPPVDWIAPPSCPGAPQFRDALRAELSRDSLARLPAARVSAGAVSGGYRADVHLPSAGESRTLRGRTCEEVLEAAVLYLALIADAPAVSRSAPVAPGKGRRVDTDLAIALGAAVDTGALPAPSPGARVQLSWRYRSLLFGADATYFDSRRQRLSEDDRFGGDFRLWTAGLDGCHRIHSILWGCAGAEVGRLGARGLGGYAAPSRETWVAGELGASAALPIGSRFEVVADAGLAVPLRRTDYVVTGLGRVHRSDTATGRVGLSLRARFFYTDLTRPSH